MEDGTPRVDQRPMLERVLNIRRNLSQPHPRVHSNPHPRLRTNHHHSAINRTRQPELRAHAQTNLLDLRALRFRLRTNYVGSVENSVPKELSLVPRLISKPSALSPCRF